MAGEIAVNTDSVALAASNIVLLNDDMKNSFADVESAMSKLAENWQSSASENAMTSFLAMKEAFNENRYNVVSNYVGFLYKQVDAGYVGTEDINTKLSEAFK